MQAPTIAWSRGSVLPDGVGFLAPYVEVGVFNEAEVHLAATVSRLAPDTAPEVLLALAVAARGPRLGHICVVLETIAETVVPEGPGAATGNAVSAALPWPSTANWRNALESCSEVVSDPDSARNQPVRPLVWDGARLYLQRYWVHEQAVASSLLQRAAVGESAVFAAASEEQVRTVLDRHFTPLQGTTGSDPQRSAAQRALVSSFSVIAGGPGTGKTTTVAKTLLAAVDLAAELGMSAPRIALAAPTGKAAARMTEAVTGALGEAESPFAPASTIHRLLGARPGAGFRRNRFEPIEADIVVIDETSMVDLSLMSHLIDAVRPDTTLVLVGDPFQLASVEAGTVLGDLVAAASLEGSPLAENLTVLTRVHRFDERSSIAKLAAAVRNGDPDATIDALEHGNTTAHRSDAVDSVRRVDPSDDEAMSSITARVSAAGAEVVAAARAGEALDAVRAATEVKVLTATRRGELGLYRWTDRIESAVADRVEEADNTLRRGERWYVGKPVMVTANDPVLGVANGDVGVVVDFADADAMVAIAAGSEVRPVLPARLASTEPWWAMTIHKSQGSEFPEVVVSLPEHESPILSRELLYTAVTRASSSVTVVASPERVREAVSRPVARASGLVHRLNA